MPRLEGLASTLNFFSELQTKYKIFQHDSQDISRRKGVMVVMEAVVVVVVVMVLVM